MKRKKTLLGNPFRKRWARCSNCNFFFSREIPTYGLGNERKFFRFFVGGGVTGDDGVLLAPSARYGTLCSRAFVGFPSGITVRGAFVHSYYCL